MTLLEIASRGARRLDKAGKIVERQRAPDDIRPPERLQRDDEQRNQRQHRGERHIEQQHDPRRPPPAAQQQQVRPHAHAADLRVAGARGDLALQQPDHRDHQHQHQLEHDRLSGLWRIGEIQQAIDVDRQHIDARGGAEQAGIEYEPDARQHAQQHR